jgi:glucose-1-phosphate thymidylyltransferase
LNKKLEGEWMKVLILAGGFAKRMGKYCENCPKPLLPLAGKKVIDHIIDKLSKIDDISDVIISTNQKFGQQFNDWIKGSGDSLSISLIVEPAMKEGEKLGSIGALQYCIDQKGIDEDLLVINGDNVFTFDLKDFISFSRTMDSMVLTIFDTKDLNEAAKYGVVQLDGEGRLIDFIEKPEQPKTTLAAIGIYYYSRSTLPKIKQYIDEGNNTDTIGFFNQWMHSREPVLAHVFREGKWFDIGTPEVYEQAERELSDA